MQTFVESKKEIQVNNLGTIRYQAATAEYEMNKEQSNLALL